MLNKIFSISDLLAKDIMHHRSFVCMVEQNATQKEVVEKFLESGFSTIAVYKETVENVVGKIDYKSVLFQSQKELNDETGYAKNVMSQVLYVPGTMNVFEVLKLFKNEKDKFAIVLDEQGGTSGVITMNDIMKVVFGRMSDESANEDVPPENRIKVISPLEMIIPGDMKIDDVNNLLNLKLDSEYFNTLGGWVLEQFGVLPTVGQSIVKEKVLFKVEDLSDRRIISVRVRIC